jgi:hypothetical protein
LALPVQGESVIWTDLSLDKIKKIETMKKNSSSKKTRKAMASKAVKKNRKDAKKKVLRSKMLQEKKNIRDAVRKNIELHNHLIHVANKAKQQGNWQVDSNEQLIEVDGVQEISEPTENQQ